jgi:hypothetical protein
MDNPRDPLNQLTQSTIEDRSDGKRLTSNVQDGPEEIPVAKQHEGFEDNRLALSAEQIAFAKVVGSILAERWAEESNAECQSTERDTAT